VVSASGRGRRQLTRDARFVDGDPAWSPDGKRIAFVREDEFGFEFLYTMNADGTDVRFVLEGYDVCCPDWSPGGRQIALTLESDLVVVGSNGSGRRVVTRSARNPSWSPDGRWIVFDSDRGDEDDQEIFVVPAGGGPAKQLTDNEDEDQWPDWSPDGRLIAFSRGDLDELESSVYVMRADGTQITRVPLSAPSAMPSWQPLP
jgi:TolB protein